MPPSNDKYSNLAFKITETGTVETTQLKVDLSGLGFNNAYPAYMQVSPTSDFAMWDNIPMTNAGGATWSVNYNFDGTKYIRFSGNTTAPANLCTSDKTMHWFHRGGDPVVGTWSPIGWNVNSLTQTINDQTFQVVTSDPDNKVMWTMWYPTTNYGDFYYIPRYSSSSGGVITTTIKMRDAANVANPRPAAKVRFDLMDIDNWFGKDVVKVYGKLGGAGSITPKITLPYGGGFWGSRTYSGDTITGGLWAWDWTQLATAHVEFDEPIDEIVIEYRMSTPYAFDSFQDLRIGPIHVVCAPPTPVEVNPDNIYISKDADTSAAKTDEPFNYTFTIQNLGCANKTINFSDDLPAGLTWVEGSLATNLATGAPNAYAGTTTLTLPNVVVTPGSHTLYMQAVASTVGTHLNRATFAVQGGGNYVSDWPGAGASNDFTPVTVAQNDPAANVTFTKAVSSSTINSSGVVTYTFTITNHEATEVVVALNDTLSEQQTFVAGTLTGVTAGTPPADAMVQPYASLQVLAINNIKIPANTTKTITIDADMNNTSATTAYDDPQTTAVEAVVRNTEVKNKATLNIDPAPGTYRGGQMISNETTVTILDDADGDGVIDSVDQDDDNDGVPDSLEGTADSDGDGTPDSRDLDSDNDGISDIREAGGVDSNNDGRADGTPNGSGQIGTAITTLRDTDGDGKADIRDLDSDNDGINDVRETNGTDEDNNGLVDTLNSLTGIVLVDTDSDGVPDYRDLDSDNDTISDLVENGVSSIKAADTNGDGHLSSADTGYGDTDGDGIANIADGSGSHGDTGDPAPANTDGDSAPLRPDYRDTDSDNIGGNDIVAAGNGALDANNDGRVDVTADPEGDGIPNIIDSKDAAFGGLSDPAGDNDGDGIPNSQEGNGLVDTDGDGVTDDRDLDSDNDGILDSVEGCRPVTIAAWSHNTPVGGIGLDYPALPSAFVVSGTNETPGSGITRSVPSSYALLSGVNQTTAVGAAADGDLLTYTFTTQASLPTGYRFARFNWTSTNVTSQFPHQVSMTMQAGSGPEVLLVQDATIKAGPLEFNANWIPARTAMELQPATTYTIKVYVYNKQSSSSQVWYDDLNVDVCKPDFDGDGIPDFRDLDSDNDGINDVREAGGTDANGDGRADGTTDSMGRPVPAGLTPVNSDTDALPNYLDLDSDNDGVSDLSESGNLALVDADGDGVVDGPASTEDTDRDGIMESADGTPTTWGDSGDTAPRNTTPGGNGDYADIDGGTVVPAPTVDTDNDGIPDSVDTANGTFGGLGDPDADDDGDGLTNGQEGGPSLDTDGDGVPDYRDLDSDNDGIRDAVELVNVRPGASNNDTDGDGKPDYRDLDSDNDGINDVREANGVDADNDGLADGNLLGLDTDGDGLRNSADPSNGGTLVTPPDTDGDGRKDYVDLDSDNDTIGDLAENAAPGVIDANNDGIVDGGDLDGDGIRDLADGNDDGAPDWGDMGDPAPTNTDGDSGPAVPDYRDLDSNNDGTFDIVTAGNGSFDTAPADGRANGPDADQDGVIDPADGDVAAFGGATNPNGDSDGDGMSDSAEGPAGRDTDGDGVEDRFDIDSDNDGILDSIEKGLTSTPIDTDGDGVPNFRDLDSDNDSINDVREAGGNGVNPDPNGDGVYAGPYGAKTSSNPGLANTLVSTPLPLPDTDGDGVKDYLDLDSDGDSISDFIECACGGLDANGDGVLDKPVGTDADKDGIMDSVDGNIAIRGDASDVIPANTDAPADTLQDYRDLDSDNDGTRDIVEAGNGALDPDGNGRVGGTGGSPSVTVPTTDTDGDGVPDVLDVADNAFGGIIDPNADADGDGLTNGQEGPADADTDRDGVPDYRDVDADNDGVTDALERTAARPGSNGDTDGDGIPDWRDLDSDNDGLNDVREAGGTDVNGDGFADGPSGDADTDNDGLNDSADPDNGGTAIVTLPDKDGDGIPNKNDLDSDNDTISDLIESGTPALVDANRDGMVDGPDTDGDGIMPSADALSGFGDSASPAATNTDAPGDTVPDYLDSDSDDDGIRDIAEVGNGSLDPDNDGRVGTAPTTPTDADRDGIADTVDSNPTVYGGLPSPYVDTDGDGLTDAQEGPTGRDTDGDGVTDANDLDSDNDGILDSAELANARPGSNGDTDGDGVQDWRDLDSDNDGINDVREASPTVNKDTNNDGKADGAPNGQGIPSGAGTGLTPPDTDGDGRKDYVDVDADGDTVPDLIENGGAPATADTNQNGVLDSGDTGVTDADGDGIMSPADARPTWSDQSDPLPLDAPAPDTDTTPNYLDSDSDGDGLSDIVEAGNGALDPDSDGRAGPPLPAAQLPDGDGDGLPDATDNNDTAFGGMVDPTADPDGDGLTNAQEGNGNTDTDGDGVPDNRDADSDNDGIPDSVERANAINGGDTDGDGRPDWRDLDSDNDGIKDVREAGNTDVNNDGLADGGDSDNDGLRDSADPSTGGTAAPLPDTDGDSVPNYLDLDSDGDTISDLVESGIPGLVDADHNGVVDGPDADGDGINNSADGSPTYGDTSDPAPVDQGGADTDSTPDYLDSRSDGVTDDIDRAGNGPLDTNNDGKIGAGDTTPTTDADRDGIPDAADTQDANFGGLSDPAGDNDGDGIPNSQEGNGLLDTDGDGVANNNDADSDNDGIPDAVERANAPSTAPNVGDTDGDGVKDWLDLDSDNDGINDVREAGHGSTDTNGNGYIDPADSGFTSYGANGLDNRLEPTADAAPVVVNYTPRNSDGDAKPNYIDLDSDNDSVSDLAESGIVGAIDSNRDGVIDGPDTDGDGIMPSVDNNDTVPITSTDWGDAGDSPPVNSDASATAPAVADALPDYIDPRSNGLTDDIDAAGNGPLDADNNGQIDSPVDTDGDGILDAADLADTTYGGLSNPAGDDDGDGIPNSQEGNGLVDTDGDGTPDSRDLDTDNDGITDLVERANAINGGDTDGDGVADFRDLDSDNDGINDVREAGHAAGDPDNNGMIAGPFGTNGLADSVETAPDSGTPNYTPRNSDNDPVPNYLDLDSDNDSAGDLVEAGLGVLDANNDGIVDGTDPDGDGIRGSADGLPAARGDSADPAPQNSDAGATAPAVSDTLPDYIDPDSDGDGTSDIVENGNGAFDTGPVDGMVDNTADPDGDGVPNVVDTQDGAFGGITNPAGDNDSDGIPNNQEGNGTLDTDFDGVPDMNDPDSDNDGILDGTERAQASFAAGGDTDGDGLPNWRDLDSDNDGINDVREAAGPGVNRDADNNGIVDGADSDNDGLRNSVDPSNGGSSLLPVDTDGDGARDYIDLDSDNDLVSDVVEGGAFGLDANDNGVLDLPDTDGDGIVDSVDGKTGAPGAANFGDMNDPLPQNSDTDATPDFRDLDSDGDGTHDIDESGLGAFDPNNDGKVDVLADDDHDGIPNEPDAADTVYGGLGNVMGDNDQDGIPNGAEGNGLVDTDGDGVPDNFDKDSDDDGIMDIDEAAHAPIDDGDTDNDGLPNWRDLDSDNDGINDVREAGGTDTNGDGLQDGPDADNDGLADPVDASAFGTPLNPPDSDNDGRRDYIDLDSDNDSVSDLVEGGAPGLVDANNDGVVDGPDTDGDGIMPSADNNDTAPLDASDWGDTADPAPADQPAPDTDSTPDYRDPDSDGDGIFDVAESGRGAFDTAPADGRVDNPSDSDGDGIPDVIDTAPGVHGGESFLDNDRDGIPDATDPDDDNDGINDTTEGTADTDGDGLPNAFDLDSDNDGIPDGTEMANAINAGDTDGDGVKDWLDLDSDNDGINDVREAGHNGVDTNGDGKLDGPYGTNGLANSIESADTPTATVAYPAASPTTAPRDTDTDGAPDYLDLDSDNDTVSDLVESGTLGLADVDNNGVVDGPDTDGDGIMPSADGVDNAYGDQGDTAPVDQGGTDIDTIPDYLDRDSDQDGADDIDEAGNGALDPDNNGMVDGTDAPDGDGIPDAIDSNDNAFGGLGAPLASGTFEAWQAANQPDAGSSPGSNNDGDSLHDLCEWVFGSDPSTSVLVVKDGNDAIIAGAKPGLCAVVDTTGLVVNASYLRPTGLSGVTITLEQSLDHVTWTTSSVTPSVSAPSNGMETVSFANLNTAIGPDGFARLKVVLTSGANAGATCYSPVQAWCTADISGPLQTFGVSVLHKPVLVGKVGSIAGNVITLAGRQSLDIKSALSSTKTYFLEVLADPTNAINVGQRFLVNYASSTATAVAVTTASTHSTLAALPTGLEDAQVSVRQFWTLSEVFAVSRYQRATTASLADQIQFWTGSLFEVNFASTIGPRWSTTTLQDASGKILPNGAAVFMRLQGAAGARTVKQIQAGDVRENAFVQPLTQGLNFILNGFPRPMTPGQRGMTGANGFRAATSASLSDQIQRWAGDTTPGQAGFSVNYLFSATSNWVTPALTSVTNQNLFSGCRAVMFLSRNGHTTHRYNPPWAQ